MAVGVLDGCSDRRDSCACGSGLAMTPYPALILWADAHSADIGTWHPIDELEDNGEFLNQTVGWVIDGVKTGHVTVCQSITPDEQADHVLHIPDGMIRQIHALVIRPSE